MTRPTARVLALLELLQAGGLRTVGDLANRLDVDERTVRRYVSHLVDLDVPVESVRGRYGGVRLVAGYRMPPLMLTGDEALAVLLGLVVGRRAGLLTTTVAAAESAAAKVRRVLPRALSGRLDALLQTAEFTAGPAVAPPTETSLLLDVAEAARDRRPVAIDHTGAGGRRTRRIVHPYGVVAHRGRWYVAGRDSASGEVRTFRVDRVTAAETLGGSFDVPPGFDAAGAVVAAIASAPHRYEVVLQVEGAAEEVRALFPPALVEVQEDPEDPGWVRVVLRAERLDWVPAVLAGIDRAFRIEGPNELRPHVQALVDRLTAAGG